MATPKPEMFPSGWTRTLILAIGGALGVLITAGIIHLVKTAPTQR